MPGEGPSLWLGAAYKAIRGQQYTDQRQSYYEERYSERVVANLARRAQQLGLQLVPLGGGLTTCKNDLSEAQAVTNQINEINYFEGVT